MKSKLMIKHLVGTLFFFALIFISAGHLVYWQGLTYLIIGLIMYILNYTILKIDSELMKERETPNKDAKPWDKKILGVLFLCSLSMYIIAGLDSGRFNWSMDFHWSLYIIGIVFTALGQLIFLIGQRQNKFFSSLVRVQKERSHKVCNTGLYKIVRHPAYMGSIIQLIGFPLLFGSLWSIIPVGLSIILIITRTLLEDKTLTEELEGYKEYKTQTKYRIIPYIW